MGSGKRGRAFRLVTEIIIAVAGSVVASFGNIRDEQQRVGKIGPAVAGALIVLIFGSAAVRTVARSVREGTASRFGESKGGGLAKVIGVAGATIVGLWTLSALGVGFGGLLLGGALTGVVLGISAQQTLGNMIAGVVLLVVKPFMVGEDAVIKSGLGEYQGRVSNIGFMYVSIITSTGRVDLPNAVALASAVGPGARAAPVDKEPAAEPAPPE